MEVIKEDFADTRDLETQEDIAKVLQGREFLLIGENHDAEIAYKVRRMLRDQVVVAGGGFADSTNQVAKAGFELFEEIDPIDKRAEGFVGGDAVTDFTLEGDPHLESDSLRLMSYE
eukprot:g12893.t1